MSGTTISQEEFERRLKQHERWLKTPDHPDACRLKMPGLLMQDESMSDLNLRSSLLRRGSFSGSSFSRTVLRKSALRDCDFSYSYLFLTDLRWCNLADSEFEGAWLLKTRLLRADLRRCNFSGVKGHLALFIRAHAKSADFEDARLEGCDFSNCDLEGASFNGASLVGCDFTGANLERVRAPDSRRFEDFCKDPWSAFALSSNKLEALKSTLFELDLGAEHIDIGVRFKKATEAFQKFWPLDNTANFIISLLLSNRKEIQP